MRALLSEAPGGPETLVLRDLPDLTPGAGELLVRVRACAMNFPDVLIIEDNYQLKPPRPFAPGGEFAGEVIGVGEGVITLLAVGSIIATRPDLVHGARSLTTARPLEIRTGASA